MPWKAEEDEGKGRRLVATRDIKPFQTILEDFPAIVGPFDSTEVLVCLECWSSLDDGEGVSCSSCSLLLCSEACQGGPRHRGERLLQTSTLIGQKVQLSSSCPIRARERYLLSNQSMRL